MKYNTMYRLQRKSCRKPLRMLMLVAVFIMGMVFSQLCFHDSVDSHEDLQTKEQHLDSAYKVRKLEQNLDDSISSRNDVRSLSDGSRTREDDEQNVNDTFRAIKNEQNFIESIHHDELMMLQSKDTNEDFDNINKSKVRRAPIVWPIRKEGNSTHDRLEYVLAVFKRIGYEIYDREEHGENWDVMWSLEYPFYSSYKVNWAEIKPHQRVNHFPKCGSMTFKVRLATEDYIPEIPKAFKLPTQKRQFLAYSKLHPTKLWVQKNDGHRGIKILAGNKLDLKSHGTFVQEYVDNPFLVDGRRFDVGIYTVMTSINPLRLYTFNEWHMRFCPEPYHPFDPRNKKKYVVTSIDYIAPWDMPSLKKYYRREGISRKESLLSVM